MSRLTCRPNTTMRIDWYKSEVSLMRALHSSFQGHIDPGYKIPVHHAHWWQRVWLSNFARHAADDSWGTVYVQDEQGEGEILAYLKMGDYVEDSAEVVYIQKWLEHTYPKARDLTMISAEQARQAARKFMSAHSKGTIVYTDSRLVGTFPRLPWALDGAYFDIRQVLTEELGKHVGFVLRNCLKHDDASKYWTPGDDKERLFIAVGRRSTKILAAFHVSRHNVDTRNGQVYALLTEPNAAENCLADNLITLPNFFIYDGVIWCADASLYYSASRRSNKHKTATPGQNYSIQSDAVNMRSLIFGFLYGYGRQGAGDPCQESWLRGTPIGTLTQYPQLFGHTDGENRTDGLRTYQRAALERLRHNEHYLIEVDSIPKLAFAEQEPFVPVTQMESRGYRPPGDVAVHNITQEYLDDCNRRIADALGLPKHLVQGEKKE